MTSASIDMLQRLVAFDTTSRNSNLDLIKYIQGYLDDHGIRSTLVPNADGTKANLFASIGPEAEGGIVLSGHTDVVPVDGQPWDTDPWTLTEKQDGNLYGRGTCDMKGFIAACLAHVPALKKARLKVPMHFAFSYDEEIGCLGAHSLAEKLVGNVPQAAGRDRGRADHDGRGQRAECRRRHRRHVHRRRGPLLHDASRRQRHPLRRRLHPLAERAAGRTGGSASGPIIDTVPGHTTINVGIVTGGTAGNILARECTLNWGYRTLPGDDPWEVQRRAEKPMSPSCLLPKMKAKHPDADIQHEAALLRAWACCRRRTRRPPGWRCSGPAAIAPTRCPTAPRPASSAATASRR
jgi:acetylornithine deacetylase